MYHVISHAQLQSQLHNPTDRANQQQQQQQNRIMHIIQASSIIIHLFCCKIYS